MPNSKEKQVSIIGFGRFGKTLYRLLVDDFSVVVFDEDKEAYKNSGFKKKPTIARDLKAVYQSDVIFYAVPISSFAKTLSSHRKYFRDGHLLIDVLSVKVYPAKVFRTYLKGTKVQALLTHPLFGPDSSKEGFEGLPFVIDKFFADPRQYHFWKMFFARKGLRVIEMKAQDHDRLAANSQGLTHFIGRLLEEFQFESTPVDTLGARKLYELKEQTCNDTWNLFLDLQTYNPYTKQMRLELGRAYDRLYDKLLPARANPRYTIYGIQGGMGSFNEEALASYMSTKGRKSSEYKISYLYTTSKVLQQLHRGDIDYGLFAMYNSLGGVVHESVEAVARYKFKIQEEFTMRIRHFLMKRKDVATSDITTVMAHPQVFKQCKHNIKKSYPRMVLKSGQGDFVDTAKAASALQEGKLPKNTAILGPQGLSKLYDLDIIAEDLQDDKENYTSFLLVHR